MPETNTSTPIAHERPAMLTSCIVDSKSTVFYVDKNGWLKIRVNPNKDDAEPDGAKDGRTAWPEQFLQIDKKNVKSLSNDMAAISYPLSGNTPQVQRSRLYYIDEKQILQELQKDGSQEWSIGPLGKLGITARKGSPITCLLSLDAKVVKVFYYAEDLKKGVKDTQPSVAWWTGGAWNADTIF